MKKSRKTRILLIEDNPGDVELTRETLYSCKILHELVVASDGVKAMQLLLEEKPSGKLYRPDLVLLDLNLPLKDGREVLKEIKEHPKLKRIPVVILTSSQAEQDVISSYELSANAFVTKPVDLEGFGKIVRAIDDFWLTVVRLPPP